MTDLPLEVIESIGRRIDARSLVERIGHHPESLRQLGSMLKCFCPIHNEQKFPTMLIDTAKRTYKCTVPSCAAFRGGSLLELYLLHKKYEGAGGVIAAARELGIPLDPAVAAQVTAHYRAEIDAAFSTGDLQKARSVARAAILVDDRNVDLLLALAQIEEELDAASAAALEGYQRAAAVAAASGDHARALDILQGEVARLQPDSRTVLMQVAEALERLGRKEEADEWRLRACEARKGSGSADNVAILSTVFRNRPVASRSLLLARALEDAEDFDRAIAQYRETAEMARREGDVGTELEALRRLTDFTPEDLKSRVRLVECLEETNQEGHAVMERVRLGEAALRAGNRTLAQAMLTAASLRDPKNGSIKELLSEVHRSSGDNHAAVRALTEAARLYREAELDSESERCLAEALTIAPDDPGVQEAYAEYLYAEARPNQALEHWREAMRLYAGARAKNDVARLAARLEAVVAERDAHSGTVADIFIEAGAIDRAGTLLQGFARQREESQPEAALNAAEQALALMPEDDELRAMQVRLLLHLGRVAEAIEAGVPLADSLLARGKAVEARALAQSLLLRSPGNPSALEALAKACEALGDRVGAVGALQALSTAAGLSAARRIELLRRLVAIDPDDVESRLLLGEALDREDEHEGAEAAYLDAAAVLERTGDSAGAVSALERAVALPFPSPALLRRTADFQFKYGDVYRAQDLYDRWLVAVEATSTAAETEAAYRHVIAQDSGRVELLIRCARWMDRQGRREEALSLLETAEQKLHDGSDPAAAIEALRLRLEWQPEDAAARIRFGSLILARGDAADAARELHHAARIAAQAGDYGTAAAAMEVLRTHDPGNAETVALLADYQERANAAALAAASLLAQAELHLAKEERAEARGALERAVQLDPASNAAWQRLAELLEAMGQSQPAANAHDHAAALLAEGGDAEASLAARRRALALAPTLERRHRLIRALVEIDRMEEARTVAEEIAASLADSSPYAAEVLQELFLTFHGDTPLLLALAEAWVRVGDREHAVLLLAEAAAERLRDGLWPEAQELARAALAREPEHVGAHELLAEALAGAGENATAAREFLLIAGLQPSTQRRVSLLARARELAPEDPAVALASGEALLAEHRPTEAAADLIAAAQTQDPALASKVADALTQYLEMLPGDHAAREAHAQALFAAGQREAALEIFESLAHAARAAGDNGKALALLRRVAAHRADDPSLAIALAEAMYAGEGEAEARAQAEQARAAFAAADNRAALRKLFDAVAKLDANWFDWRLAYAQFLVDNGDREEWRDQFTLAAQAARRSANAEDAYRALAAWRAAEPRALEPLELEGQWRREDGDAAGAAAALLAAGELRIDMLDYEAAVPLLQGARDAQPRDIAIARRLAEALLHLPLERNAASEAWRNVAMLCRETLDNGGERAALGTLAEESFATPAELERLSGLQRDAGERSLAARTAHRAAAGFEAQENLPAAERAYAASLALEPGDIDRLAAYGALLERMGDGVRAAATEMELVRALHSAGREEEAEQALLRAFDRNPSARPVAEEAARHWIARGDAARAVDTLTRHADSIEDSDPLSATEVRRRALEMAPREIPVRRALIRSYLSTGHLEEAALEELSIGRQHSEQGDREGALRNAQIAVEYAPRDVRVRLSALGLLLQLGEKDAAAEELDRAVDALAESSNLADLQAYCSGAMERCTGEERMLLTIAAFCKERNDEPQFLEAAVLAAQAAEAAGERDRAEGMLAEAIATASGPAHVAHEALIAYLERSGAGRRADLVEALAAYEKALAKNGETDRARRATERILAVDKANTAALSRLAEMNLAERRWADALENLIALGHALEAAGRHAEAIDAYRRALGQDSDNLEALRGLMGASRGAGRLDDFRAYGMRLSEQYRQLNAEEEVATLLEEISEAFPSDIALLEQLADAYRRGEQHADYVRILKRLAKSRTQSGEPARAIEALREIEAYCPDDVEALETLGEAFLAQKDIANALHYLTLAAEKHEMMGELEPAARLCDRIVALAPDSAPIRTMRSVLFEALGKLEDAANELSELARIHLRDRRADLAAEALAHLLILSPLRLGKREEYARLLRELDRRSEASDQLELIALEYDQSGRPEDSKRAALAALELSPGKASIHIRLAAAYESLGDLQLAVEEHIWLARHHAAEGRIEAAESHLEQALEIDPGNFDAKLTQATILRDGGKPAEAAECFARLATQAVLEGDLDGAVRALECAREGTPDDLTIRRNLADLRMRRGETDLALAEHLQIVRIHIEQGLVEEAQAHLAGIYQSTPVSADFRRSAATVYLNCGIPELAASEYIELSRVHRQAGEWEESLRAAQEASALRSGDPVPRRLAIDAEIALGRTDRAAELQRELADLFMDRGKLDAAGDVLREAVRLKPTDVGLRRMVISALEQSNRPDDLVRELRGLADLHLERGEVADAAETLKRLLAIRPDDTRARIHYIEAYRIVGSESDLIDDYLKLAELHMRRGALNECRRVFERLLQLDTARLDIRDRFIEFLLRNGEEDRARRESYTLSMEYAQQARYREAQAALQRVAPHASGDPEYHLQMARVHLGSNARGMALRELRIAADGYDAAGNRTRWRETLHEMLRVDAQNEDTLSALAQSYDEDGNDEQAAALRGQLAELYTARGLYDLAEAELRRVLKKFPRDTATWERLIAARRQFASPEELDADITGLAEALIAAGRHEEGLEQLGNVIQRNPRDIAARRRYVLAHLRSGDAREVAVDILALGDLLTEAGQMDEALEWYGRLIELDPGNTEARERMSNTQARKLGSAVAAATGALAKPNATAASEARALPRDPSDSDFDLTDTHKRLLAQAAAAAPLPPPSELLTDTLSRIDREDEKGALSQIIQNYRDILAVNGQNANVRIKLADVLLQAGDREEALRELATASEILFSKGELNLCVGICERILSLNPRDQRVRDRLTKAVNKRDAFKAIESAILYSDQPHDDFGNGRP